MAVADNRRFYWLKLHDDFFNRATTKYLRKLPEGDAIVIIYLELLCISLSSEGYIYTDGLFATIEEDLALMLDEDVMHVKLALAALEQANLITRGMDEPIFMKEFPNVVGSETATARRVREHRKREKELQAANLPGVTMKHQCNTIETPCNTDETMCNTEKETEIEKEIESEREGEKETFLCGTYHNVRLSQTDLRKLQERFPDDYRQKIDRLSRYMQSSKKSYKNHYLTICKWAKQDEKRALSGKQSGFPDYNVKEGESY